ncbi:hypothetical protein EMIT0111MI5_70078 [Burkholderia sp. IT-111MI5]
MRAPLIVRWRRSHALSEPRTQQPGFEHVPVFPHNLRYTLDIVSPEPPDAIRALHQAVEAVCPIFNLLRLPQTIDGELRHTRA